MTEKLCVKDQMADRMVHNGKLIIHSVFVQCKAYVHLISASTDKLVN